MKNLTIILSVILLSILSSCSKDEMIIEEEPCRCKSYDFHLDPRIGDTSVILPCGLDDKDSPYYDFLNKDIFGYQEFLDFIEAHPCNPKI